MEEQVQDIITYFNAGNENAFRKIYEQYASPLRYFASKYLADKEAIDDLVQDAFVHLWKKRRDFTSVNTIKAFLYQVVQRACLNIIRHQKVKDRYTEYYNPEEDVSFLDNVVETEVFREVLAVFEELSPAAKAVYKMSLDGIPHEEIATQLRITIHTVKKHKNNANHFMRERLKHLLELIVLLS